MSSVIRTGSEPRTSLALPRLKSVVGVAIVAVGLWLSVAIVRELLAVVADPGASAWLETFRELPAAARTLTTPQGEYRLPPILLQVVGLALLAVFLYCLTNLAAIILRIGGWMMRDDAEELLKKIGDRIDAGPAGSGSKTNVQR